MRLGIRILTATSADYAKFGVRESTVEGTFTITPPQVAEVARAAVRRVLNPLSLLSRVSSPHRMRIK